MTVRPGIYPGWADPSGRPLAGIVGQNPAGDMEVCLL